MQHQLQHTGIHAFGLDSDAAELGLMIQYRYHRGSYTVQAVLVEALVIMLGTHQIEVGVVGSKEYQGGRPLTRLHRGLWYINYQATTVIEKTTTYDSSLCFLWSSVAVYLGNPGSSQFGYIKH